MDSSGSNGAVIDGAIVKVEHSPMPLAVSEYHRRATDVAGLVREMVLKRTVKIGAKNYVPVECYQAVANAMGCVASARDVKRVEGGYTAVGEVKRLSDGVVVSEGEGFVGDDEPKWKNGPEYARRSMVQTRAIGRACRAAFAFVVPMIDAGLSTTPAEEMDGVSQGSETPPAPTTTAGIKSALRQSPPSPPHTVAATPSPPRNAAPTPTHDRTVTVPFGRNKGKTIAEVDEADLKYLQGAFQRDLDDPSKSRFHDKTRAQLAAVTGELQYRGL